MYAFLFDRRSLTLLVVGLFCLAGLLFFGGVLVGIGIEHDRAHSLASPQPSPATAVGAPTGGGVLVEPLRWRPPEGEVVADTSRRSGSESAASPPPPPATPSRPPVVTQSLATGSATGTSTTSSRTLFTVQVGAFSEQQTAFDLKSQLVTEGWTDLEVRPIEVGGTTLFGVQMGCWDNISKADAAAQRFAAAGHEEPVVKVLPPGTEPPAGTAASDSSPDGR